MAVEIPVPIVDLIRRDLGEPARGKRRPFWLCPFHEERTPSLTITPDGKHWKCFGCTKSGDAISWVRERKGVSFLEAVSLLQGRIADRFDWTPRKRSTSVPVKKNPAPSVAFSNAAELVVSECSEILASPAGAKAHSWLLARGLTKETITHWRLGFNPQERWHHGLLLRRGITIPWFDGDTLLAVKIRRADEEPKYEWVSGGQRSGLYLADTIKAGLPTLLVEGEFDALVGWQEFRDIVNVATLGSASDRPDQKSLEQIISSPVVLVCYDRDKSGQEGAAVWQELSDRMRVIVVPKGKDLNDFCLMGGNLRGWISNHLKSTDYKLTRHPTVDQKQDLTSTATTTTSVRLGTRHLPDTSDGLSAAQGCPGFEEEVTC